MILIDWGGRGIGVGIKKRARKRAMEIINDGDGTENDEDYNEILCPRQDGGYKGGDDSVNGNDDE